MNNIPHLKPYMNLEIENPKLNWLNFAGRETEYNEFGKRNFQIELDPETAEEFAADGANVKFEKNPEPGCKPKGSIKVHVTFPTKEQKENGRKDPVIEVWKYRPGEERPFDCDRLYEPLAGTVDNLEYEYVDVTVRTSPIGKGIAKGKLAFYLQEIHFHRHVSDMTAKYDSLRSMLGADDGDDGEEAPF